MKFESLVRLDDFVGEMGCWTWNTLASPNKSFRFPRPRKVLVSKLRGIGDVVLALPLIRRLAAAGTRVVFLGGEGNYQLVRGLDYVDKIFHVDLETVWRSGRLLTLVDELRRERIDAAIDLTQSSHLAVLLSRLAGIPVRIGFENKNKRKRAKNGMYTHLVPFHERRHIAVCYFDLIACLDIEAPRPFRLEPLPISGVETERAVRFLEREEASGGKVAGVHLSSPLAAKRWPLVRWAGVLDRLIEMGYSVVAVGSSNESPVIETARSLMTADAGRLLNAAGRFGLSGLIALLARFEFFLANDGGPMHMAAAMGLPTLALFGAEHPDRYAPYNGRSRFIYKAQGLECSPCARPYMGSWPVCQNPVCLAKIETSDVLDIVTKFDKAYGGRRALGARQSAG
jgi:heptosyltransferase-2